MNPEGHPPEVVNIAIGQNVNVDKAVELGSKQMKEFENGWPKNFNGKLSRVVKTQSKKEDKDQESIESRTKPDPRYQWEGDNVTIRQVESGKYIKVGDTKVLNTELIYTRVIDIQVSSPKIDIKQLLSYELSPVPTAMFSESGEMKVAKAKSVLK